MTAVAHPALLTSTPSLGETYLHRLSGYRMTLKLKRRGTRDGHGDQGGRYEREDRETEKKGHDQIGGQGG